jgi:Putative prokaryotic signal transducing protein
MSDDESIVCPTCARAHPPSERFCAACGMPLVQASGVEQPTTPLQRRARKIKPAYTEGPLVKVAHVDTPLEAEFVAGLLLEEGIPSVLSGSISGYSPVLGARDILVAESGAQAAREALTPPPRRPES